LIQGKKEELPPYLNEVRGAVLKLITDQQTKKVDPEIYLPGLGLRDVEVLLRSCCALVPRVFPTFWMEDFAITKAWSLCIPSTSMPWSMAIPKRARLPQKARRRHVWDLGVLPILSSIVMGWDMLGCFGEVWRPAELNTDWSAGRVRNSRTSSPRSQKFGGCSWCSPPLATNRAIIYIYIVIQVLEADEAVRQVLVSWWITPQRRHWLLTQ
jgi:hypothetical protein